MHRGRFWEGVGCGILDKWSFKRVASFVFANHLTSGSSQGSPLGVIRLAVDSLHEKMRDRINKAFKD